LAEVLLDGIYSGSAWAVDCHIAITARRAERAEELRAKFPDALVTLNNADRDIWDPASKDRSGLHALFLCTRPVDVPVVSKELASTLEAINADSRPVVVTMCPGITVKQLQSWLPQGTCIVRAMPNTPVGCRQGATGLFASENASHQVNLIATALRDVSPAVAPLAEERLLDVVAAIAG
jgi:pyrroline-5-carboxylate reductase